MTNLYLVMYEAPPMRGYFPQYVQAMDEEAAAQAVKDINYGRNIIIRETVAVLGEPPMEAIEAPIIAGGLDPK